MAAASHEPQSLHRVPAPITALQGAGGRAMARREITDNSVSQSRRCRWHIPLLVLIALFTVQCSFRKETDDAEWQKPEGAALQYDDGETIYVTASSLRIRELPSESGRAIGSLSKGDSAEILKRSGEWLQVLKLAEPGWISAKHVSAQATTSRQSLASVPTISRNSNDRSKRTNSRPERTNRQAESRRSFSWFGQKQCKKGKPCGNACISASRTCHK